MLILQASPNFPNTKMKFHETSFFLIGRLIEKLWILQFFGIKDKK